MRIRVWDNREQEGRAAAEQAAAAICRSIAERGTARIVGASAASQIEFLEVLTASPNIAWDRVELFHLDEYIGLPPTHPASFCRFLEERLIAKTGIRQTHLLRGDWPRSKPSSAPTRRSASPPSMLLLWVSARTGISRSTTRLRIS